MSRDLDLGSVEFSIIPKSQSNYVIYNYPQVDRLLEIHRTLGGTGRGRRHNLEVVNKSAIVLICAFWEAFVEDLTGDVLYHFAEHARSPQDLPVSLRKSILKDLQSRKHELAFWDLADANWRELLRDRAQRITSATDRTLSSPTSQKVDDFFAEQAGISNMSEAWHWKGMSTDAIRLKLDGFIALRNAIAHRGGPKDATVLRKDAVNGRTLMDRLIDLSIEKADMDLTNATNVALVKRFSFSDFPSDDELYIFTCYAACWSIHA